MVVTLQPVGVLFASASRSLAEATTEHFRRHNPGASLVVVSEFPTAHGQWIRFYLKRSLRQNLALCRWRLRDKQVEVAAIVLEPRSPFLQLKLLSLLLPAKKRLAYNENGDFFEISWKKRQLIFNHLAWRWRNWLAVQRSKRPVAKADAAVPTEPRVRHFEGTKRSLGSVLIASPYIPFPLAHGGAVRIFNLMKRASRDFELVLLCFVEETVDLVPPELMELCAEIVLVERRGSHLLPSRSRPETVEEFDWPSFHQVVRQATKRWKPQIAQLEFTQMAQYVRDCRPAKTILVEHDITFDLFRQMQRHEPDWETAHQMRLWTGFEKRAWRAVDRVVVMSEQDRLMVEAGRSTVLPNGVDVQRFSPIEGAQEEGRILFIGSFNHLPNLVGLGWFLKEVWPLLRHPHKSLHIISGARHEYYQNLHRIDVPLEQPGVTVEGFVPDVRTAYARAAVVIVPLKVGAGTCIKVLEAMAMGKPVVSTDVGLSGLDISKGREVVEVIDAVGMGREIDALLHDRGKRKWMGENARERAVRDYSWDAIAAKQLELYRGLIGSDSPVL